ncbi:EF-hand calcium-binding domain-containing protein 4A [Balamuthia mandrillaris]
MLHLLAAVQQQPASTVEVLPPEMLLEIFSHLRSMEELCAVSQVCRLFAAVSREDLLWKPLGCPAWQEEQQAQDQGEANGDGALWKRRYMKWMRRCVSEWLARRPSYQYPAEPRHALQAEDEEENKQLLIHLSLIGSSGVGKTSFVHRFGYDRFREGYHCGIGLDFLLKRMKLTNDMINAKVLVWEPCGAERWRNLPTFLLKRKHGVAFCYDSTDLTSFLELNQWLERLNQFLETMGEAARASLAVRMLIGLKCDEKDACQVSDAMAEEMAAKLQAFVHIRTSAKTGENVDEAVRVLAEATLNPFVGLEPCQRPAYIPDLTSLLVERGFFEPVPTPAPAAKERGQSSTWRCVCQ